MGEFLPQTTKAYKELERKNFFVRNRRLISGGTSFRGKLYVGIVNLDGNVLADLERTTSFPEWIGVFETKYSIDVLESCIYHLRARLVQLRDGGQLSAKTRGAIHEDYGHNQVVLSVDRMTTETFDVLRREFGDRVKVELSLTDLSQDPPKPGEPELGGGDFYDGLFRLGSPPERLVPCK